MSNAEHLVENLILGMKAGRDALDILDDPNNQLMLEDPETNISGEEAVRIACHVVWGLYDGQFPTTEFSVGDEVRDTLNALCVITHINDRHTHVLYPNGKTHRFPTGVKFQETGKHYDDIREILSVLSKSKEEQQTEEAS